MLRGTIKNLNRLESSFFLRKQRGTLHVFTFTATVSWELRLILFMSSITSSIHFYKFSYLQSKLCHFVDRRDFIIAIAQMVRGIERLETELLIEII